MERSKGNSVVGGNCGELGEKWQVESVESREQPDMTISHLYMLSQFPPVNITQIFYYLFLVQLTIMMEHVNL